MIETQRLVLRRWREEDRAPFAAMHNNPEVAYWLGGPQFVAHAAEALGRYNQAIDEFGFGKFALERRADGLLLGAVGVMPMPPSLPIEGFEIGWRLARWAWGEGYATEAAQAAVADGFRRGLDEIIAFTTSTNLRSQAVMARLGMVHDPARDFDHPEIEEHDPLRPHVVYVARPK